MNIKKLILKGYRRFSLKKIDEFVFEPKNKLTILNWKNGFGKSSLLAQLNPLPAELKKDFYPGGYKIIEFEHNGKDYESISKDGKYSLLENGIELNPGGTKKVQSELIQSIFGLNQHILNVINGNTRFTEMSPSERKQWLTKISTVDFDYSLKVYSKIMTRKSDLISWIKLTSEKIIECNKVLGSYEGLDKLKEEESLILETIESFLKEYRHEDNFKNEEEVFNRLEELVRNKNRINYLNLQSEDKLIKNINILEDRNKHLKQDLEKLYEEYKKLSEIADNETINSIKKENEFLEKQLYNLNKEITLDNINTIADEIETHRSRLTSIVYMMEEMEYDKEVIPITVLEDKIRDTLREMSILETKMNMIKEKLEGFSIGKIEKIRCPSCSNEVNIKNILNHREEEINKYENLLKDKRKIYKELEYDLAYSKKFEELKTLALMFAENKYIKEYVNFSKDNFNFKKFLSFLEDINVFIALLRNNYYKYLYKKKQNDEILYKNTLMENMNKEMKEKQKELISLNVKKTTEEINNNVKLLNSSLQELNNINSLKELREEIMKSLKDINVLKKEEDIRTKNRFIKEVVTALKERSILVKNKLESYNIMKKNNDEYNKELEKYKDEIKVVELLLKALSPTSGLIAKSINSFLGVVIDEMNGIINSIWNYKMTILPCDLEEGVDLTYRFKVKVNDDNNFIIEDVSKLSSSMREIVDLSFRLVFIKYINLGSLPIMLDEFGRTMDSEHRINAFNMVDEIIVNSFDQVFLVSHFEEMYGRFRNADFPTL